MPTPNKRRRVHFKVRRRRGSYLGVTGKYPTRLNPHSLFYESLRERDLFVLLAFHEDVERVEDHPFTIEYEHMGRKRKYTPDALIKYTSSKIDEVIEVKIQSELARKKDELEIAFEAARKHCKANQRKFRVITEVELPRPYVRNLRFLMPYRAFMPHAECERQIRMALKSFGHPMALTDLCSKVGEVGLEEGEVIAQAWRLVSLRQVRVSELDKLLSMHSLLEIGTWSTKL